MSEKKHWLYRPENTIKLWIGGAVILVLCVALELFIAVKGHFGFDEWLGFNAVFGFISCVLMVLLAKVLGFLIKRRDDYYEPADSAATSAIKEDKA